MIEINLLKYYYIQSEKRLVHNFAVVRMIRIFNRVKHGTIRNIFFNRVKHSTIRKIFLTEVNDWFFFLTEVNDWVFGQK